MNPWRLILATVIIFGAGVVVGGMLVYYTHPRPRPAHHPQAAGTTNRPVEHAAVDLTKIRQPELFSPPFVQKLDDALQLTPAQRVAIQKIIAEGQQQTASLWTNWSTQTRQELQLVRQQIREQLNPDQRKDFEKLLKQNRPAQKHSGTNSIPALTPPTNSPAVISTNLASGW